MEASAVPRVAPTGVAAFASPGLLRLLSDDRLVALIRDGNRNAFEALYDRHHRAILSFCRHMLGSTDEAEDAVQHTFLAAYKDLVSSRKPIRLRAWLFTIARNRCLSILRARRDRAALEFEEQATDGLAVQVQRRQDLRDLVGDINHLPEDQRAALVLAEIGALTHDEIGSVIGVPREKVKALVFQARESLLASRAARETDCFEIREQLATMRGGALRRTTLRRHLRECQGCRDYRHEVESQRRRIAVILPVIPTIALREAVLGLSAGGAVAGAGAAGGGLLGTGSLLKGVAGKALIATILAAVGTTGILVTHDIRLDPGSAAFQHPRASTATSLEASAVGDSSRLSRTAGSSAGAVAIAPGLGGSWHGSGTAATTATSHSLPGRLNGLSPGRPATGIDGGVGSTSTGAPVGPAPMVAPAAPATGVLSAQPLPVSPGSTSTAGGSGSAGFSGKGGSGEGSRRGNGNTPGSSGSGGDPGSTGGSHPGSGDPGRTDPGKTDPGTTDPGTIVPGDPSVDSGKGSGSTGSGTTGDTGSGTTGDPGTGDPGTGDPTGGTGTGTTGTGDPGTGDPTGGTGTTGTGDPTDGTGTTPPGTTGTTTETTGTTTPGTADIGTGTGALASSVFAGAAGDA